MKNKMLFLGTAAADVLPNPFCSCPLCVEARENPKHQRLRSAFLLSDELLIDCGPDLAASCARQGVSLENVKNVLVTHSHDDHFCPSNSGLIAMSRTKKEPVDVYLSEQAYAIVTSAAGKVADTLPRADAIDCLERGLVRLHPLKTFETVEIGGCLVMPVRTTHKASHPTETAVNYLIRRPDGKKILYACDTGLYPEDTLEALAGSRVDTLIMEGTFGSRKDIDITSHLTAGGYVQMLEMMLARDIIRRDTHAYVTHINHKHDFTHEKYQAWLDLHAPIPVTVAYDGLQAE